MTFTYLGLGRAYSREECLAARQRVLDGEFTETDAELALLGSLCQAAPVPGYPDYVMIRRGTSPYVTEIRDLIMALRPKKRKKRE